MNLRQCGAKARTNNHQSCRKIAMPNGRCHLHGGKSSGAKTEAGIKRIKLANTKHGFYSAEAIAERRVVRALIQSVSF